MARIRIAEIELEAAEGPGSLKCWPPESLGPTLEGYARRVRLEGYDWGSKIIAKKKAKATRHGGHPKGRAVKQCKENIDQRGRPRGSGER